MEFGAPMVFVLFCGSRTRAHGNILIRTEPVEFFECPWGVGASNTLCSTRQVDSVVGGVEMGMREERKFILWFVECERSGAHLEIPYLF